MTTRSLIRRSAIALLLGPALARAEAVTDPNQIVGTVRLRCTNPAILDVLRPPPGLDQGVTQAPVEAIALVGDPLRHRTDAAVAPDGATGGFDLTVESSIVGIPYELSSETRLDGSRDVYRFETVASPAVLPDPAPDVSASFDECLSMLDVRYELDDGTPLPWDGGRLWAARETSPGSGSFVAQAWNDSLRSRESSEYLPVHGGATFTVDVEAELQLGSDPELDTFVVRLPCHRVVDVACDEMVPITCVFTAGDCTGPGMPLGRITGIVDVVGEEERHRPGPEGRECTRIEASAADGNGRLRVLRQEPSSGPFALENVLPDRLYAVRADVTFGDAPDDEALTMPLLGSGSNPPVPVASGVTTDLGDTFVLDPGIVRGDVVLAGPPPSAGGALLQDVVRGPDGRSFTGMVTAGIDAPAPGATSTAWGGMAWGQAPGGLDLSGRNYIGSYRLRLGGLHGEASLWDSGTFHLALQDRATPDVPEQWHDEHLTIHDDLAGDVLVEPGATTVIDRRYCFSEVQLRYRSTTGTFVQPSLGAAGTKIGRDWRGEIVAQSFTESAKGTPLVVPSDRGLVAMTLPEGAWDVAPRVKSVSPRGVMSDTELPPVKFPVGCRQVIALSSDLIPILDTLPECTRDVRGSVDGSFQSRHDVVRVAWSLNGSPATELCSPCGNSPSFAFPVTWEPCRNELFVEAEDTEGNVASVRSFVTFDAAGPVIDATDLLTWPPNHLRWCWEDASPLVRVTDACPDPPEWTLVSCTSDQPDDAEGADDGPTGDGNTQQDCVLAADGHGFCIRAERLGGCPEGRTYRVAIHAVDGCGNVTDSEMHVRVPHDLDAPPGAIARPDWRGPGAPPFEIVEPTDPDASLPMPYACR